LVNRGSSTKTKIFQSLEPGATIEDVWEELRSYSKPDETISKIDRRILLALINGTPIVYLDGWYTHLSDGDQITFMIKTAGG
jgi:molybdopterin converting factor small subunit